MDLSKTFSDNDIVKKRFGRKLDAIKNIKMTKSIVVATPIIEIANKLGWTIGYEDLGMNGYIDNKKIIVNNFDTPARQRYTIALFLSRKLQPELSETDHVRFTNELLLPEKSLRLAISEYFEHNPSKNEDTKLSSDLAQHLANIFIISQTAIEFRLHQLNWIYD